MKISYLPLPSLICFTILYIGLGYISIGVLLIGLSTMRAGIAYGSLQITLWITAIALWYHHAFLAGAGVYNNLWPFYTTPISVLPWLGATLLCSFILTGLHGPIYRFLYQIERTRR